MDHNVACVPQDQHVQSSYLTLVVCLRWNCYCYNVIIRRKWLLTCARSRIWLLKYFF